MGFLGNSEAGGVSKKQGELDQRSRGACDIRVQTAESRRQGSGSPQSGKLATLEAGEAVSFTRSAVLAQVSWLRVISWRWTGGYGGERLLPTCPPPRWGVALCLPCYRAEAAPPYLKHQRVQPPLGNEGKPLDPGPGSEECWWREELGLKLGFVNILVKALLFLPLP